MNRQRDGFAAVAVAIVAVVLLTILASGCASSRSALVDSAIPTPPSSGNLKQVHYRDVQFDVPSAWPVVDLVGNPRQCVLFNVHAVYLGHEGANPQCPARALGRTDAVQVEPLDAQTRQHVLASPADSTIGGQKVAIEPDGSATRSVVASFVGLGVTVTATYATDPSIAMQIVDSVQPSSGAS
jgi:hypothetical protein